jgi:hypothetical protein
MASPNDSKNSSLNLTHPDVSLSPLSAFDTSSASAFSSKSPTLGTSSVTTAGSSAPVSTPPATDYISFPRRPTRTASGSGAEDTPMPTRKGKSRALEDIEGGGSDTEANNTSAWESSPKTLRPRAKSTLSSSKTHVPKGLTLRDQENVRLIS